MHFQIDLESPKSASRQETPSSMFKIACQKCCRVVARVAILLEGNSELEVLIQHQTEYHASTSLDGNS